MKEVPGLINAKGAKPPNPKASPKDFVWPNQRDADDKIAQKLAATLQELLPKRGWKHTDLAKELYGTAGAADAPRNTAATRRWVLAEHPIPNEETAGYLAQVLDVSMARLLEPEGKFNPLPPMIRPRSDSPRFHPEIAKGAKKKAKKAKSAGKTATGRDREKQRAYNNAYRARLKAEKAGKPAKRKYTKHVEPKGNGAWVLPDGIEPPDYKISSEDAPPGHVNISLNGIVPHERAMAILHMLQHNEGHEE